MKENNIDSVSKEIQELKKEVRNWQELVRKKLFSNGIKEQEDKWLSLNDLIDYLPGKPARTTIYGWVSQGVIPYHKYGKKLTFLKSEIDLWLFYNAGDIDDQQDDSSSKKIEPFR